jgi:hypothetical protein
MFVHTCRCNYLCIACLVSNAKETFKIQFKICFEKKEKGKAPPSFSAFGPSGPAAARASLL